MAEVLVTGANGFLGTALVGRLLARGEKHIRCLVRPGSQTTRLDALDAEHPGKLEIVRGTLTRPDDCASMLEGGVATLYHVAAAMDGTPAELFLNTVVGSKNLIGAVLERDRRIKIVLVSSFGVYGVANLPRGSTVEETTLLEPHPEWRDPYTHAKLRQEQLFWECRRRYGVPLVVMRPGVLYGPGGPSMSGRVGLDVFGLFLHLGGDNVLPLACVDNCAEAIAVAGQSDETAGQIYNVIDDDLPTAKEYLAQYRQLVRPIPYVTVPWVATRILSWAVDTYHQRSRGQLPAVLTPYKSAANWKGQTFDNKKLKSIGYQPLISTAEGLKRHFDYLRASAVEG